MTLSIYASPFLLLYGSVLALVFGAALGSFLNCAAWRMARGESFLTGRSRCPKCGHVLGAMDLVPVLSWLLLRRRCRYCGERVPARYPVTEIVFALLTLACLLRFDLTLLCARNLVFLCCLFCLSLTDLDDCVIPDGCLLTAALAWAVTAPFLGLTLGDAAVSLLTGLALGGGMLGTSLVMDRVLKKDTLGGGDIKLLAAVGLYLGPVGSLFALMLACVLGLVLARALQKGRGQPFPFGPAIAAAAAGMLLFGDGPVNWYLGLLGM